MIESYLLEYFIAVYEEGNILKASEKLHVSQPSVTKAIQKLENELDLSLFERTPNRVILNKNGKIIADYIKNAITLNNRIKEKAHELKIKEITIKIDSTAPGPTFRYPNFFYFNKENNPYTLLIKDEIDCINSVKNGISDLAFINHQIKDEELYCEKILEETLYVSLPKTHFLANKKDDLSFKELDGQSFIIVKEIGIRDKVINKHLKKSRFFRQGSDEVQELVNSSSIPTFVTNISIRFKTYSDRIFIPIIDQDNMIPFYVICKKNKLCFLDKLKNIG